jgi:hypothetical protein
MEALIYAKTAAVNYTVTPEAPTATAGTDIGIYLDLGLHADVLGEDDIQTFKAINAVASSGALVRFCLFY